MKLVEIMSWVVKTDCHFITLFDAEGLLLEKRDSISFLLNRQLKQITEQKYGSVEDISQKGSKDLIKIKCRLAKGQESFEVRVAFLTHKNNLSDLL